MSRASDLPQVVLLVAILLCCDGIGFYVMLRDRRDFVRVWRTVVSPSVAKVPQYSTLNCTHY